MIKLDDRPLDPTYGRRIDKRKLILLSFSVFFRLNPFKSVLKVSRFSFPGCEKSRRDHHNRRDADSHPQPLTDGNLLFLQEKRQQHRHRRVERGKHHRHIQPG